MLKLLLAETLIYSGRLHLVFELVKATRRLLFLKTRVYKPRTWSSSPRVPQWLKTHVIDSLTPLMVFAMDPFDLLEIIYVIRHKECHVVSALLVINSELIDEMADPLGELLLMEEASRITLLSMGDEFEFAE